MAALHPPAVRTFDVVADSISKIEHYLHASQAAGLISDADLWEGNEHLTKLQEIFRNARVRPGDDREVAREDGT